MPARRTIAERRANSMRERKNLVVLLVGAVPIIALVILGSVFAYRHFTELGPNELPSTISEGTRNDIHEALVGYYDAVATYNPETISHTMLGLDALGDEEFTRMELQLAVLQSEGLKFEPQLLGSTVLKKDAGAIEARIGTNYGVRDFLVVRRDGFWKIASVPDLSVPSDAGPVQTEWKVLNSFHSDGGDTLFIFGTVKNVGSATGFLLSTSGYVTDGNGHTLRTGRPSPLGDPYLHTGETAFFQIALENPPGQTLDVKNFTLVPDFRASGPQAELTFVADEVSIQPNTAPFPFTFASVAVTNAETVQVRAQVSAILKDASGAPLAGYSIGQLTVIPPSTTANIAVATTNQLPKELAAVRSADLSVFAGLPRPQGQ